MIFLPLFLIGCEDIIEGDLSGAKLEIIAPRNGAVSSDNLQQFVWEEQKFALNYKLQIAKPNFMLIDRLVLDTIIEYNKIELSLPPGSYEWRIKAINASSESQYFNRSLTISDTTNLNSSTVVLNNPGESAFLNNVFPTFRWESINNAAQYNFLLFDGEFNQSNLVIPEVKDISTFLTLTTPLAEGTYSWGVRAENALSNTLYSSRSFTIDVTTPFIPILLNPADSVLATDPNLIFTWSTIGNSGSPEFDSIFITSDTALSNVVVKAESLNSNFSYSFGTGNYYWAVKRYDKAGNTSWLSDVRTFTIP